MINYEATLPRPAATTLPTKEFIPARVLRQFLFNTTVGRFDG
ncbi:MAG: hypothetical protein N3E45_08895 [Oscillatoriaceae bacterium SKW80]|nr:hypothetical protein [Oscillatoriaceae bacterium SKYG93]MCX8120933.1 hypothetical protein [Oscillatoriaceae bacterium SKW80]MDW8452206.1 hypothetical protein [Oscillatoriaceae cyanobacterium SKYGB_i_bin93]